MKRIYRYIMLYINSSPVACQAGAYIWCPYCPLDGLLVPGRVQCARKVSSNSQCLWIFQLSWWILSVLAWWASEVSQEDFCGNSNCRSTVRD